MRIPMSLFDVLRYPISNQPTEEEINRLPADLFWAWVAKTEFTISDRTDKSRVYISAWYKKWGETLNQKEIKEISILRKMIKEYDEPI